MTSRWTVPSLWSAQDRFYYGDCVKGIQPRLSPDGVDRMCPAWQARIEKAKREIEKSRLEASIRQRAESLTDDEVAGALEVFHSWAV